MSRNVRYLRPFRKRNLRTDTAAPICNGPQAMIEAPPVATQLKSIRESAGVSVREMARRLEMSPSSYKHYENPDRFKGRYLPQDLAQRMADAIKDEASALDILRLAILQREFEESEQPRFDTSQIPPRDMHENMRNTQNDELNRIKIALVGDRLQIAGTYDREGTERLIEHLKTILPLLDS